MPPTFPKEPDRAFCVAPMMDWTDRHCRFLHRRLSKRALLFTEMVTSAALVHGEPARLLEFDPREHPLAVQLGGSDPDELVRATRICDRFGFDEINLNVGCPSDRVQSGNFGACLMAEPDRVAACVTAMRGETDRPVTVKCRIGIDESDVERDLDRFADAMAGAGVAALYVHARKAWLEGLSPKENRDVPPLDHGRVHRLAARMAPLPVVINGGIGTLAECREHLRHVSGVMLGRAAYQNPMLLARVDQEIFGDPRPPITLEQTGRIMADYAAGQMQKGARLHHVTRHMIGLARGLPGAKRFRQILTMDVLKEGAGPEVIGNAFAALKKAGEPADAG